MNDKESPSFKEFLLERISQEKIKFFGLSSIQKAYFIGAYSQAVIRSSFKSEISKENTTYKNWLSNQIINYRNLDRIFEMAFRYEQKLKLKIRNNSEVRKLADNIPIESMAGISNSKITYAFVAGFDDYIRFCEKYPNTSKNKKEGE